MAGKIKGHILVLWAQLRKGIFQMLSANVLNKMIQMLSNMAITRLLSKADYGLWSFVLNQYSYLNLLTGLGLLSGAFQFGTETRNKKEEFEYYRFCLRTGILIDTILVAGFFAASFFIDFSIDGAQPYLRVYAPILLLEYILNLLLTVLRCENRIPEYAKILNLNTAMIAMGTCLGAFFGVWGVIIGKYTAYVLSIVQVVIKTQAEAQRIKCAQKIKWPQTKALWHYSLFVGASAAMNSLLYLLDVSMIAELIGDPLEVATYKVATLIPTGLSFIPSSVIVAIMPNIVQNNQNAMWLRRNVKKTFFYMGLINFGICAVLYVFSPFIISIVSGEQYLSAVPAFRILVIEYFFNGTFKSLSTNILASLRCVNYGLFLSTVSAISDVALNLFFIQKYGMIGAAYATLGVVLIVSVIGFSYLMWKIYRGSGKNAKC